MSINAAITPGDAKARSTAVLCHQAFHATRQRPLCAHTNAGTTNVSPNSTSASFTAEGYRNA